VGPKTRDALRAALARLNAPHPLGRKLPGIRRAKAQSAKRAATRTTKPRPTASRTRPSRH
jgi:hypothetical protein